jgi:hypothetical protein
LYLPPATIDPKDMDRYRELERAQWADLLQGRLVEYEKEKKAIEALQNVCFFFSHSHNEAKKLYLHPQMLADSKTVLEVLALFRKHFSAVQN